MKKKRSAPRTFFTIGILWLVWSWVFPLFSFGHFAILIVATIILANFAKKIWPDNKEQAKNEAGSTTMEEAKRRAEFEAKARADAENKVRAEYKAKSEAEMKAKAEAEARAAEEARLKEEAKPIDPNSPLNKPYKKRKRTGDAAIDKMLDDEEKAIHEMRRLDDAIIDEKLSAQIVHLEEVTTKIVDFIVEHPQKRNQVRKFFNYYLPTSLKLLNAYDRMDETGISGVNIDGTKGKVEEMMDTALNAFDKQLDALYADEALDVSSEIKVMENMLAQEGLTGDAMQQMLNK